MWPAQQPIIEMMMMIWQPTLCNGWTWNPRPGQTCCSACCQFFNKVVGKNGKRRRRRKKEQDPLTLGSNQKCLTAATAARQHSRRPFVGAIAPLSTLHQPSCSPACSKHRTVSSEASFVIVVPMPSHCSTTWSIVSSCPPHTRHHTSLTS